MGSLVDTGLGWYLDEDYLLTLGNVTLASVVSGGGPSQYDLPLYTGALSSFTKDHGLKTHWAGSTWTYYDAKHTDVPVLWCYAWNAQKTNGMICIMSDYPVTIYEATYDNSGSLAGRYTITLNSHYQGVEPEYWYMTWTGSYQYDPDHVIETPYDDAIPIFNYVYRNYYGGGGSTTSTLTKPQGGAGAFAIVSYPHDGETVYVGVGISSIGIPNSAATVAVDGVNGSYNTFNREGAQFTMFYTEQLTGELTANVPVVALDTDISGLPGVYEPRLFLAVADAARVHVGFVPADGDPYADGGTSEPSAGTPDFTEVSESISPGSTFPISFQSTGLCRVYVPSITDLNDLANYLWTDQTFLDTIKNILINQFENFMEAVISLTMVPCQVPKDTAQPVKVMFLSTGLSFPPATQQFVEVDCGYVDITERYASALDYNPYTKVSLYLPFIGTVPLDTDEVMGHRVKCVYTIDIVSGACVAKIMVNYPDTSNGVLYQFSGHCSISMPLTAADFSSYYAAAMSGLKMAAGMAAAGAGAPGLAGALLGEPTAHPSSTTTVTRTTERNAATGRQILSGTESKETSHTPGQASFKELATRASVNTVGAVINSKFSVEHSGGFTGNTGFLGVQAPYVIITRPDMCNPDEYGAYNGRPSMMYLYLGNLSGFTQVQNIKLTGIPATNPELGEIAELLKTGVIL